MTILLYYTNHYEPTLGVLGFWGGGDNPKVAINQSVESVGTITQSTSTGGGGAHNNVQPTIILNYIIKT